jgi:integrase
VLQAVEERDKDGKLLRTRYFDSPGNPIKRWGWHNLRHSLASWLVSNDVDVKTVSSMLRHSNVNSTLAIYSHAVDSKKLAVQGQYLNTLLAGESVQ